MLTDLEYAVLGVIYLRQPCTAYAVRMVFATSLSSHWSGSSGSIYPLMRRLGRMGIAVALRRRGDGRGARLYRLTPRGRSQLKTWVGPPMPAGSALMGFDPLRARFRFLNVLPPNLARQAIREAMVRLDDLQSQIREEFAKSRLNTDQDRWLRLSHRGAELAVKAQQDWLKELLREIS